jgi:putative glutamine amidotransferase
MQKNNYPLIGVTADIEDGKTRKHYLNESYAASVYRTRSVPLALVAPAIRFKGEYEILAENIITRIDGLFLSGGDDFDARLYHEENYAFNGCYTEERDLFEIALCREAVRQNKPILGICRGIQTLNVAMGGSLFQDIAAQHPEKRMLMHAQQAPAYSSVHDADVLRDSLLARILLDGEELGMGEGGSVSVAVNSFHHQAVNRVAPGFVAVASTHDGIIEAIEPKGKGNKAGGEPCLYGTPHPFTVGVQWHPERMEQLDKHAERLFLAFTDACRKEKG